MSQLVFDHGAWPPDPDTWRRVLAFVESLSNLRVTFPLVYDWGDGGPVLGADLAAGFWATVTAAGTNGSYSWQRLSEKHQGVELPPVFQSGVGEGLSGGPRNPAYVAAVAPPAAAVPVGAVVWLRPGVVAGGAGQEFLFGQPAAGFSGVRVKLNPATTYALASGISNTVSWDAAEYDTGGFWSAGTPTVLTIPADGHYLVTASAVFAGTNGTGDRYIYTTANVSPTPVVNFASARATDVSGASVATGLNLSSVYQLFAAQTLTLTAWQNSGVGVNLVSAQTFMTVSRLGG